MAMTKCKECGEQISTKAESCPKCGAKRKKTSFFTWFVLAVFLLVVFVGFIGSNNSTPPNKSNNPKLLLLDWAWNEEYGYAIAEGEVKNISSENLKAVEAVVNFYTASETFISSGTAIIEYNPILPGQTSPFKVYTDYNPEMQTAKIYFKELMGGTIPYKKSD